MATLLAVILLGNDEQTMVDRCVQAGVQRSSIMVIV
jgi:hypothetical protein